MSSETSKAVESWLRTVWTLRLRSVEETINTSTNPRQRDALLAAQARLQDSLSNGRARHASWGLSQLEGFKDISIQQASDLRHNERRFPAIQAQNPSSAAEKAMTACASSGVPRAAMRPRFADTINAASEHRVVLQIRTPALCGTTSNVILGDWELGPYRVEILPWGDSPTKRIDVISLSPNAESHCRHPHFVDHDHACWGSFGPLLMGALDIDDYPAVLALVRRFLSIYNAQSPLRKIESIPHAKRRKPN